MNRVTANQVDREATHLFSVRVWYGCTKDGSRQLRGRAQHVLTGETHHFEDWRALHEFLAAQLESAHCVA